jgi:REP element-mobilizing transposase RayT
MRKNRNLVNGAYYHVTARINRKDGFLLMKPAKLLFLKVLKEAQKKYKFILRNFTVMSNHYHLLIQPIDGTSLSRIMQWINSVFAIRINKLLGSNGHVWGQRFWSRVVEGIVDYVRVGIYINQNPVVEEFVTRSEDWEFCQKYFRFQEQLRC